MKDQKKRSFVRTKVPESPLARQKLKDKQFKSFADFVRTTTSRYLLQ